MSGVANTGIIPNKQSAKGWIISQLIGRVVTQSSPFRTYLLRHPLHFQSSPLQTDPEMRESGWTNVQFFSSPWQWNDGATPPTTQWRRHPEAAVLIRWAVWLPALFAQRRKKFRSRLQLNPKKRNRFVPGATSGINLPWHVEVTSVICSTRRNRDDIKRQSDSCHANEAEVPVAILILSKDRGDKVCWGTWTAVGREKIWGKRAKKILASKSNFLNREKNTFSILVSRRISFLILLNNIIVFLHRW